MHWQTAVMLSGSALTMATAGMKVYMESEAFDTRNGNYCVPIAKISIILPTLNEEDYIIPCLESLKNQTLIQLYPDKFEIILVDGSSNDRTVELAKPYVDKVILTESGKLTQRNRAMDYAKGNIIVAVDADTIYPPRWLDLILRHFFDPNTVGVSGATVYGEDTDPLINVGIRLVAFLKRDWMKGGNSAFRKEAYYQVGRFNENINQFYGPEVLKEEEYDFPKRLRAIGKVVYDSKSVAFASGRRNICMPGERCERWVSEVREGKRF